MALNHKRKKFKLKNSSSNIRVVKKKFPKDIHGEAIDGNTVAVSKDLDPKSKFYKEVVAHEKHHAKELKTGKIAYGDDWVRDNGKTYPRKDGEIKYNGKWYHEGHKSLPWEKRAENAEKNV